jgi:hypothetical protein
VDKNSLMASGGPVKKRHYKGILLAMSLCAKSVSTKDYTYMAVPPDTTLALDPAMPKLQDPGPSPPIQAIEPDPAKEWNVAAILGGLAAGAAAGAVLGYLAGNKDPLLTVGAGALGALAGAGLGSLF